ncbi:MAG TPA: hypothetical protein VE968_08410, partial [Sphingomicrobium sp.]|nr:hypothetical protein [Sphingomicrobium sp.]
MRKLPAFLLAGLSAAALAGTATAASRNGHFLNIALPDGSTAHIEYAGDVAPKVTIEPSKAVAFGDWVPFPAFASLDRMMEQIDRETQAMLREAPVNGVAPIGTPGAYVASFGNSPANVTSTTIVSYSNGKSTCTRETQTISQGPGKPPKV